VLTPYLYYAQEEEEEEAAPVLKVHKKTKPAEPEDEMLNCRDCNAEFAFTVGEQEFYKSKVHIRGCVVGKDSFLSLLKLSLS
jgi:hypothetical protein